MGDLRILSLEYFPLNLELTESFTIASGAQHRVENVLVRLTLDNGIFGLGEAAPFPAVSGETQLSALNALKSLKNVIEGADAADWKVLAAEMKRLFPHEAAARCAIEMALFDAFAKSNRQPLHRLFGGKGKVVHTDMTITAGDVDHARHSALAIQKRGIRTIKIKTAGKQIELDVLRVKAVAEAVPGAPLLIDGNGGYTLDGAIEFADRVVRAGINPIFFEQPLHRDDWKGMRTLAATCSIPVAADESARDLEDVKRIVEDSTIPWINLKLMKSGVVETLEMIELAQKHKRKMMIGGMVESRLAMNFSAHLAAGTGAFELTDLDTPMFIMDPVLDGGWTLDGDKISLSDQPGHGVFLRLHLKAAE